MLKLKKLLFEVSYGDLPDSIPNFYRENFQKVLKKSEEFVQEYNQNGTWYRPESKKFQLYRGSDSDLKFWDIKSIRQNRKPRDTKPWVDQLVENIRSEYYPNVPSRRAAKFAASSDNGRVEIQKYGAPFVVFPQQYASKVSIPSDPFDLMGEINTGFSTVLRGLSELENSNAVLKTFIKGRFDEVYKFLVELDQTLKRQFDYTPNSSPSKIVKNAKKAQKNVGKSKDKEKLKKILSGVVKIFEGIESYFSSLIKGVLPNSGEVMYGGRKFLRIRYDFWKHFIEHDYENGKVKNLATKIKKNAKKKKRKNKRKKKMRKKFLKNFASLVGIDVKSSEAKSRDLKYISIPRGYEFNDMKFVGPDNLVQSDGVFELFIEFPDIQGNFNGNLVIENKSFGNARYYIWNLNENKKEFEVSKVYENPKDMLNTGRKIMRDYFD